MKITSSLFAADEQREADGSKQKHGEILAGIARLRGLCAQGTQ